MTWMTANKKFQVWPLIHFFLVKNNLFAFGAKLWPLIRDNIVIFYSCQPLPCLSLGPLKGFLSQLCAFKGPQVHLYVAHRTAEIQGLHHLFLQLLQRSQKTIGKNFTNLDGVFIKTGLFKLILDCKKANRHELSQ